MSIFFDYLDEDEMLADSNSTIVLPMGGQMQFVMADDYRPISEHFS